MTSRGTEKIIITIGVDISKDTLDAHRLPEGASRRFANTPAGHKALIAWAGRAVTRIVFEPTGPYHAAFERALARADLPMVKVNPRQALKNGRCPNHGGLSTGRKSPDGRARIAAAQRARWHAYRAAKTGKV